LIIKRETQEPLPTTGYVIRRLELIEKREVTYALVTKEKVLYEVVLRLPPLKTPEEVHRHIREDIIKRSQMALLCDELIDGFFPLC